MANSCDITTDLDCNENSAKKSNSNKTVQENIESIMESSKSINKTLNQSSSEQSDSDIYEFSDDDFEKGENDSSKGPVNEAFNKSRLGDVEHEQGPRMKKKCLQDFEIKQAIDKMDDIDDDDLEDLEDDTRDTNDDDDTIVDFLVKTDDEAEARLAARRQARVEAKEIRMRELERLQKEHEENADRVYDMYTGIAADPVSRSARVIAAVGTGATRAHSSSLSSRRSSEDSLEDGLSLRDVRHELRDVEERFRKAMIANAQLDNDKTATSYQLQLLKDRLEDLEETHAQLQREHKDKCREHDQMKRALARLTEDLDICKAQLNERDMLITDAGLVIVGGEINEYDENGECSKRTLVSVEGAKMLEGAGEGSLDVRLRSFAEERKSLQQEVYRLQQELSDVRSQGKRGTSNGPLSDADDLEDVQREANKQLSEARFRLQKAEQEASSLQAVVARLESQVVRYKSSAEASEKAEEALKVDKRKLQRESREALARVEELETANNHLLKRLDKLKNAKSALLKEL